MSKTDELISKLEELLEFSDGKDKQIINLNLKILALESEISKLKEQIKKEEKEKNEQQYIRMSRVFYFVVTHKTDCYRAFKLSIKHEGYKSPEGKKLITLARQEIGYSDKTWSGDIYSSLYNTYKSIVVEGVNEPEQIPDLDCGIYEEKQSTPDKCNTDCIYPDCEGCGKFIPFPVDKDKLPYPNPISKHQTDINIGWVRAMKYMDKQSSDMCEFVISEIKKGIVHPNPLTSSEMRVLNLCCKYMESHE